MKEPKMVRPAWVEINLDNATQNYWAVRKLIHPKTKLMAVVKGDAYGCSSVLPAQVLVELGAEYLAVAILDEALELRRAGISAPVLVLGFTPPEHIEKAVEKDITLTVYRKEMVEAASTAAIRLGKKAKVHIKIDTGMGRIGLPADEQVVYDFVMYIRSLKGIEIEGLFSHFSVAEMEEAGDREYTFEQCGKFRRVVDYLEQNSVRIPLKHIANSAGIYNMPKESHFDMVRTGSALFGITITKEINEKMGIRPVISIKAKIGHIKEMPAGQDISYGRTYTTKRKTVVATLPIGYADGYSRLFSNRSHVLVNGQKAPQIGLVCMDQCMIDVTDIHPLPEMQDEVVLMGKQGSEMITAGDLARLLGPVANDLEVVTHLAERMPRVYIWHGRPVAVHDLAGLRRLDE